MIRTTRRRCVTGFALLAAVAIPVLAADWTLLGSRKITDRLDHDTLEVSAVEGELAALQLRVKGAAVQFRSMTVHFANGSQQLVELREAIPAGGQSRVIDLVGPERIVRSVDFAYESPSLRGRQATVRLFGKS